MTVISEANFLVWGGGGVGQDLQMYPPQKHIYFQVSKYLLHPHIKYSSLLLFMVWRYIRQYIPTKH